ncbi:MAG: succinylglutamate desuccinylase/aspartoacylase family protein [Magnetococcus sp. DMHC-6]
MLPKLKVKKKIPSFDIGGVSVKPGTQQTVHLPVSRLYTHTPVDLTVHVVHGSHPGPCLFVSAAIHGDELNGVEICRRLLECRPYQSLQGTLLVIPVVNVLGFLHKSRYFPDRRDLNRSFPGLSKGSLAAQTADLFMREIVARASYGIDLHSGTQQRFNLPQTRGKSGSEVVEAMARAFNAPVHLNTELLDGSLRQAAFNVEVPVLLFEGGEGMSLDEVTIRVGLKGILGVMYHLKMLAKGGVKSQNIYSKWCSASSSSWVRAPESGMIQLLKRVGTFVHEGEILGRIYNPLGKEVTEVRVPREGVIIGHSNHPLVHQGDALFHIAFIPESSAIQERVQERFVGLHEGLDDEFL